MDIKNELCSALKRHLDPSIEMLDRLIDCCPDELWLETNGGFPFWQQVYHTAYWCHRWFRESYNVSFVPEDFGRKISPHLDDRDTASLTIGELKNYMAKVKDRIEGYFKDLDDRKLLEPVKAGADFTYYDVIISQIRHIQYHVGHCDSILRDKGKQAVDWIAFMEGKR